jgi:hypothetical protein
MTTHELRNLIREEVRKATNEHLLKEDAALIGNIALGVAGGLVGLWALVKGTKAVGQVLGFGAEAIAYRMKKQAEQALESAKRGRIRIAIKPIIAKFENDSKLKAMYQELPEYDSSMSKTSKEQNRIRAKQLQTIAKYIKSKLTPEEMEFFEDISSTLRTGDFK